MQLFDIIAILVALTALFSYVNHRHIRLHPNVGVMLIAMIFSLALMVLGKLGWGSGIRNEAMVLVGNIHFGSVLLRWMLGFLLFAGAMSLDLEELLRQRGTTASLAVVGTVASMFIIGGLSWVVFKGLGFHLPMLHCLLLGALISPTDPVAVLAFVRQIGMPKDLETIIAGESLFNDGVGVVLFFTLLELARGDGAVTSSGVIRLFVQQCFGGAGLGVVGGFLVYRLMKKVHEDFQVIVLLTLALAMGVYSLADALHVSGPIAVVVAGLMIGNRGKVLHLPAETVADLSKFWSLIEEVLNAVLFVLMGLEIVVMPFSRWHLIAALVAIPLVLTARWASVAGTLYAFQLKNRGTNSIVTILTWGGLRGGLPIAMALSLPPNTPRNLFVAVTYGVVAFSILVQGTTIGAVVAHGMGREKPKLRAIPRSPSRN